MVLAGLILSARKRMKMETGLMVPLMIYVLYAFAVVASYSIVDAVYALLNVFCCVIITVTHLRENKENTEVFFKTYVLVALLAAFTGWMGKNALIGGSAIEHTMGMVGNGLFKISRFTATFEDPNYMGFFFTIAVFATITLKLFKPMMRTIVIALLYVAIFASLSMTALVVNVVMWLFFLTITRKMNLRAGVACIVAVIILVGLYQYGLNNPNTPIVGGLSYRIHDKLMDLESGDMAGVTTGRTDLARAHLQYYFKLPLWKMLVGGVPVNAGYISSEVYGAAHNEYVDMLLNVGFVGTVLMLWYMAKGVYSCIVIYRTTNDNSYLCKLMCKCVWLAYAAALTMFLEYRFMLPFFI